MMHVLSSPQPLLFQGNTLSSRSSKPGPVKTESSGGWYRPDMTMREVVAARYNALTDETDYLGNTALIIASKKNKPEVVQYLLGKYANINHQNHEKRTALMEAARKGHGKMVQLLLDYKANPSLRDVDNRTAQDLTSSFAIKQMIQKRLPSRAQNTSEQHGGWGGLIKKGIIGLLLVMAGKSALEYGAGKSELVRKGLEYGAGKSELIRKGLDQVRGYLFN